MSSTDLARYRIFLRIAKTGHCAFQRGQSLPVPSPPTEAAHCLRFRSLIVGFGGSFRFMIGGCQTPVLLHEHEKPGALFGMACSLGATSEIFGCFEMRFRHSVSSCQVGE